MDTFCEYWDRKYIACFNYDKCSTCFDNRLLTWLPSLYLWCATPFELYFLKESKARNIPFNVFNGSKVVLLFIIASITIANIVQGNLARGQDIYCMIIRFLSYILCIGLTIVNVKKGVRSSANLFLYSFILLCFDSVDSYLRFSATKRFISFGSVEDATSSVNFLAIVGIFILNWFADESPKYVSGYVEDNIVSFEKSSSFLSNITNVSFTPFILRSLKKPIETNDLYEFDSEYTCDGILRRVKRTQKRKSIWTNSESQQNYELSLQEAGSNINSTVLWDILKMIGPSVAFTSVVHILQDSLGYIEPLLAGVLIDVVQDEKETKQNGFFYCLVLLLLGITQLTMKGERFSRAAKCGLKVKTAVMCVLYEKVLSISIGTQKEFSTGKISNLFSTDVQNIYEMIDSLNYLWIAALHLLAIFTSVYFILGTSAICVGIVFVIFFIVTNVIFGRRLKGLHFLLTRYQDKRLRLINEVLVGIREDEKSNDRTWKLIALFFFYFLFLLTLQNKFYKCLKVNAWELGFEKKIAKIREKEIFCLQKYININCVQQTLWACGPLAVALITFVTYSMSSISHVPDARIIFVSFTYLTSLLRIPLYRLTPSMMVLAKFLVSYKRIKMFLDSQEVDAHAVNHNDGNLCIKNGFFSWNETENPFLNDININIHDGSLIMFVGSVGSGKSSLISAFLGEMPKISGYVNVKGTVAYVPQHNWILNDTVRENITLGKSVDADFYNKILEACDLNYDLKFFPAGDLTEIGERGINLSGGQKQRISLARAICFQADTYFFDDPLSAVDVKVGEHLFNNVLGPNGMLNGKTRIVVTHNIKFLAESNCIYFLKAGSILYSGQFNDLMENNEDFSTFIQTFTLKDNTECQMKMNLFKDDDTRANINNHTALDAGEAKDKIIQIECGEMGFVKKSVFKYYLETIGFRFIFAIIFTLIVYHLVCLSANVWLSVWVNDKSIVVNGVQDISKRYYYNSITVALVFGMVGSGISLSYSVFNGLLGASKKFHKWLTHRILHWPVSVFDSTPVGRILNRFGSDMHTLDFEIGINVAKLLYRIGLIISFFMIIFFVTPTAVFGIVVVCVIFFFIQRPFVKISQQLKRVQSISLSPIYAHVGETIAGLTSVHAYRLQKDMLNRFKTKVDEYNNASYHVICLERSFLFYAELLGATIIFMASMCAVSNKYTLDAGTAGLLITYSMQVIFALRISIQLITATETNFVSVERIKEYHNVIEENEWYLSTDEDIPSDWPKYGIIHFDDIKICYRDGLNYAINGVTISINQFEKVGIVGRTGSGKTTLALSLFRTTELAGGKIMIDGIDISKIGLHTLRSHLTIISQDPVLFWGTLRDNIDPLQKYTDDELWKALESTHLKDYVLKLPDQLSYEITEGGGNLSLGQRQLICLARAILRKTKILVMDEATAAIDLETDSLIQNTIRKEFSHCTVLTVAHRINTIVDYDRILVMQNGFLVEFDKPEILLKSKTSFLYKMIHGTQGISNF